MVSTSLFCKNMLYERGTTMASDIFFKTHYGYKGYSAFSNKIINVDSGSKCTFSCNEVEKLKEKGYFKLRLVKDLKFNVDKIFLGKFNRNLSHLVLQITQNCNLSCSYCAFVSNSGVQRLHANINMSFETSKKAIDYLWRNSIDSPKITIGFYGGEPFLNFKLMKQIVMYCLDRFEGKEIVFNATTNGTILNDEILEFIKNTNFIITFSLDGSKVIHDVNRKFKKSKIGSYDIIIKNIYKIHDNYPNLFDKMRINVTLDPSKRYVDYLNIYDEIPIINSSMVSAGVIDDDMLYNKNSYSVEFLSGFEYDKFLAILNYMVKEAPSKSLAMAPIMQIMNKIQNVIGESNISENSIPSGPCVPGMKKLFVNVDGDFYPCEKIRETSIATKIGDVYEGIDFEAVGRLMNIQYLTSDECNKCWAFRLCESCALYSDNGYCLDRETRLNRCAEHKATALYKLKLHIACMNLSQSINKKW